MSKNAGRKNPCRELGAAIAALEKEGKGGRKPFGTIVARVLEGWTVEDARAMLDGAERDGWRAFSIESRGDLPEWIDVKASSPSVTPFREARGVLTAPMFFRVLQRELSRVRRGASLSLVGAALLNREALAGELGEKEASALEALLGSVILPLLEDCDSVGILRKGQYLCCLPGMGQLAAREFAENVQKAFSKAAASQLAENGADQKSAACALGIVNLLQGESGEAESMLNRARQALEMAFTKPENRIHQENSFAPLENTTLVHSSEKKFLFFGGNAS